MVSARRQNNHTILLPEKQQLFSDDRKPRGCLVRFAETVESPKGLLGIRAKTDYQHLILIGVYNEDYFRLELLQTQIIERTLKDRKLNTVAVSFHDARDMPQPFGVGDIIRYKILFSAHGTNHRVVNAV